MVRLTLLTMAAIAMCDAAAHVEVDRPGEETTNTMTALGIMRKSNSARTTRRNRRVQYIMKTAIVIAPEGRKQTLEQKSPEESSQSLSAFPPEDEAVEGQVSSTTVDELPEQSPPTHNSTDLLPTLYGDKPELEESDRHHATPPLEHDVTSGPDNNVPPNIIISKKPYYYKHRSKKQDNMMQKIDRDEAMHGPSKGDGKGKGSGGNSKGAEKKKSSKKTKSRSASSMKSKSKEKPTGSAKGSTKGSSGGGSGKGSSGGGSGMGKGKGNGNGPIGKGGAPSPSTPWPSLPTRSPSPVESPGSTAMPTPALCNSDVAVQILGSVPQAITKNPSRCCLENGPTAVFVTHAVQDNTTSSGFEPFWDNMYATILEAANRVEICFVMTGVRANVDATSLPDVLINVLTTVSSISEVPAMLTTDPTSDVTLLQTVRSISNSEQQPSIGVFNAGYDNIIIEAIVTGQERLQYIGYLNEAEFGRSAGKVTLELLAGIPARPLCFNARVGQVNFIEERCASYYTEVTDTAVIPEGGIACSSQSNPNDILQQLLQANANAVWSHLDCCSVVAEAVGMAEVMGRSIVTGCMDMDTTDGQIDFVTEQPSQLQAYQATTWVAYPVVQDVQGRDGRGEMYFPALQSLINTAVYNVILA
jgi:hypothetical protein